MEIYGFVLFWVRLTGYVFLSYLLSPYAQAVGKPHYADELTRFFHVTGEYASGFLECKTQEGKVVFATGYQQAVTERDNNPDLLKIYRQVRDFVF
jgi:hypothetical protein